MKRETIAISDEGAIVAPRDLGRVRMSVGEIAALMGVYYPTAKRHIRAVERAGIATGDYKMCCVADRYGVHPEFYGLEMVSAVAFRVRSWQADKFRRWLMERITRPAKWSATTRASAVCSDCCRLRREATGPIPPKNGHCFAKQENVDD